MLPVLISSALSLATGFFKNKQAIGKAKATAKIESAAQEQTAKIENSTKHIAGWGDEYLILVWSYPFTSMFIPPLRPHTVAAFEQLNTLPDWYVGGFITITFAVFGISKIFKFRGK
jgi:hypothetical protein